MRTLVVEDDPDVQFLVRTLFSPDPGFSVIGVAESAEDAIEMARDTKPQIIVLDPGNRGSVDGVRRPVVWLTAAMTTTAPWEGGRCRSGDG